MPQQPSRFLAAVGDSNDPLTWSGIPYHFLQSARTGGLLDEGLPLSTEGGSWRAARVAWNMARVFGFDRPGGYQYSEAFLERLWRPVRERIKGGIIINCFQLYAPSVVRDPGIEKWFFIDQTLLQLFDYYEQRPLIGRRIAREAISAERAGYAAARGIIVHSRWAEESLLRSYAIPQRRIHVVVPGANLDASAYARWEAEELSRRSANGGERVGRPVRLLFVGKYWRRKGLDRLLRALALGRRSGLAATLRVVGCERETLPRELRNIKGVEWTGFLDKRKSAGQFLRTLAECDVGCLLSRVEAGGIALREYHALGLAVLGTDAGGAAEHMISGASIPVSTRASDEEIASKLLELERDSSRLRELRDAAWRGRRQALWETTVERILSFWPHEQQQRDISGQPPKASSGYLSQSLSAGNTR
ncbi:MAG TPA: glycosyltransferase family 4 protein [Pyrinomonadaceae bacterium]|jgi:glycosyltransferase involved in cell wall biosynthesis|nr:glycosyltransferase family 4 protein [Pyrinomonadaceae bacterium]